MKKLDKKSKLAIGIALGVAIGMATHKLALWLPIGVGWGLLLCGAFGGGTKDNTEKDEK